MKFNTPKKEYYIGDSILVYEVSNLTDEVSKMLPAQIMELLSHGKFHGHQIADLNDILVSRHKFEFHYDSFVFILTVFHKNVGQEKRSFIVLSQQDIEFLYERNIIVKVAT